MGGGGAAEVQALIEGDRKLLSSLATSVGVMAVTGEDEVFTRPRQSDFQRTLGVYPPIRQFVVGDVVRDWRLTDDPAILFPYSDRFVPQGYPAIRQLLWPYRTTVAAYICFGKTRAERGMMPTEYGMLVKQSSDHRPSITFAFVATHNHFVLDRGEKVFNRTAPIIKLPASATVDDHLSLLGLLNSSAACFWMKQVFQNRGGQGINEGAKTEMWERFTEFASTQLHNFPIASSPLEIARALDAEAQRLSCNLPSSAATSDVPNRAKLDEARAAADSARARMIALQEELDWRCYGQYGLIDNTPEYAEPPPHRLG